VSIDLSLQRYITFVPAIAFPATLQSSWEAIAVAFGAGLLNGGPTALVWGTFLCIIGTTAVALSMGEMASM
jgi:choline transport protein